MSVKQSLSRLELVSPLLVGLLAGLSVFGSAWWLKSSVDSTLVNVTQGLGERYVTLSEALWRYLRMTPTPADLEYVLKDHSGTGLRYLAYYDPDGQPLAAAGKADAPGLLDLGARRIGRRVRLVRPLPPPRGDVRRLRLRRRLGRRDAVYRVVIEYRPTAAERLARSATAMLVVAAVAAAVLFALAFVYRRSFLLRRRLERRMAAESELARLGEAAAMLAHEIRNPLASLKGHAQLLEEQVPEDSRARGKVETVIREAERLERLTRDLLAFVRSGTLNEASWAPADVLRLALADLDAADFDCEVAASLGLWRMDGERVANALSNLLRNACEANAPGAQTTLRVARADGTLYFEVRDQGPGVPAATLARLFEPFQSTKTQGTGLGLSIAKRIIEAHGGALSYAPAAEGGARFVLSVPAHRAQATTGSPGA